MKRYIRSAIKDISLEDEEALERAAKNSTNIRLLDRLASHPTRGIRELVAKNPHTSIETLKKLADTTSTEDLELYVVKEVAKNPNTPVSLLYEIYTMNCPSYERRMLQNAIASNPNTPAYLLLRLDMAYRSNLASNPNTPAEVLRAIIDKCNAAERTLIAKHPNTPPDILARLLDDTSKSVRTAAKKNPNVTKEALDAAASSENIFNKFYPGGGATAQDLRFVINLIAKEPTYADRLTSYAKESLPLLLVLYAQSSKMSTRNANIVAKALKGAIPENLNNILKLMQED